MDKFGEKIREALHETANGFEVPDETKERIAEKIIKAKPPLWEITPYAAVFH